MSESVVWMILLAAAVAVIGTVIIVRKRNASITVEKSDNDTSMISQNRSVTDAANQTELSIHFEDLPSLTETEESRLVEITNKQLVSRIDGAIPGTLQAIANAGAIHNYSQAVQSAGQLYQAIIPEGANLVNSRVMENAVRGFYRGPNGIKGHANLVAVDGNMGGGLATMNVANAVMGVGAMVVGQYYMTQINNQLQTITDGLDKISSFQNNEYKSKIYALVAEIQKYATFRLEIMENDEVRNRELMHLRDLEHECAQLLGQANLTLQGYAEKTGLDYDAYEKQVGEANIWYQYQQVLLEVMSKTSELTYAMNLGAVSKENAYAMVLPYIKQADTALAKLKEWHKANVERLEIDVASARRKLQGIEGFLMNVPALFDANLHYKGISERTVSMISSQRDGSAEVKYSNDTDHFQEDVRLIAKDGKLYYLPSE